MSALTRARRRRLIVAAVVRTTVGGDACLLGLTRSSFHWQHLYWYDAPVAVAPSDTLRVTCRYDTTANDAPVSPRMGRA